MYTEEEKEKNTFGGDEIFSDKKHDSGDDMYMELMKNIESLEEEQAEIENNDLSDVNNSEEKKEDTSFSEAEEAFESVDLTHEDFTEHTDTNGDIEEKAMEQISNAADEKISEPLFTDKKKKEKKPVRTEKNKAREKTKKGPHGAAGIVIPLALICGIVALALAFVNHYTTGVIKKNNELEKQKAVMGIFGDNIIVEKYNSSSKEIYLVKSGEELIGYCVAVSPSGFGGKIDMMVGVNRDGTVSGVNIVSMSETPGLGTKTKTPGFLEQFIGKNSKNIDSDVDAITGATVSSKAVAAGVREALNIDLSVLFKEPEKSETDTEAPTESETESLPSDTESESIIRITQPVIDKVESIMQVRYFKIPNNNVSFEEDSLEYRTETESSDDTETETETETETPKVTTADTKKQTSKKEPDTPKVTDSKTESTAAEPKPTETEPETTEQVSETEPEEQTTGIDNIIDEPEL